MTKLIIQIPCYNEAKTLPITLSDLPRKLPGISIVEWLVIDDGSDDETAKIAFECGVDHIIRHSQNLGLAKAFATGLEACIRLGADVIVNTDADNQYMASDIARLIEPIISGKADIVVGARPISTHHSFSVVKKLLQKIGSSVVRIISKTSVSDAPSGFRAFSRSAAMQLHVFDEYTYTLETIIQAGHKGIAILTIPIGVNDDLRPSRLISHTYKYVLRSAITIFRIFITYRSFAFYSALGLLFFVIGLLIGLRFLYYFILGVGQGHVQSLMLSTLLLSTGVLFFVVGSLADLISVNRKLLEKIDLRVIQLMDEISESKKQSLIHPKIVKTDATPEEKINEIPRK